MSTDRKPNYPGRFRGTFPSLKMPKAVPYIGILCRELLYFLEFDTEVLRYESQPFAINSWTDKGKAVQYWPDYIIERTTGMELVKCVPARYVATPSFQQEHQVMQQWADTHEYDFLLVTDVELRRGYRLANLQLLWRYARVSIPPQLVTKCHAYLGQAFDQRTFGELAQHLDPTPGYRTQLPYIYALAFRHILETDIDQQLSLSSPLWYTGMTGI